MRIAQISDLHITKFSWNPLKLFPKRIFSYLHWIWRRQKFFSFEPVEKLPEIFSALGVDLVLIGGDFTSTSLHEEFLFASSFVQKLTQPWIAIPGNHDMYTKKAEKEKTYYQYLNNKKRTLGLLSQDGVEAHQISSAWWVLSLDTSFPNLASKGRLSETTEQNLIALLEKIPSSHKILLLNHYPFFAQEKPSRSLERREQLQNILERYPNIVLYLHGHTHRHSIADLRPSNLPIVVDSGSCGQKIQGTWNLFDLQEQGCIISRYSWIQEWTKTQSLEFAWK